MIKEFRKAGRQYVLTGTLLDAEGHKASRAHFSGLKLDSVLRTARENFRSQPLKVQACRLSLMELLVLLISNGIILKESEYSELFFSTTQLFQNREWQIRRLVYVLINELHVKPSESFIISASLLKDTSDSVAAHRGKAMRRFAKVLDSTLSLQLDQQVKNSIVDKDPLISGSGLVYCQKLIKVHPEVVRRWSPEISSAITKHTGTTQSLAVRLILETKRNDRLALQKQLFSFFEEKVMATMDTPAQVAIVQHVQDMLCRLGPDDATLECTILMHLSNNLCSSQEGLCFQAAKTIVHYVVEQARKGSAVPIKMEVCLKTLMIFLGNPSPLVRMGAMRSLYSLSTVNSILLGPYAAEIEGVLSESHATLSVLALSTLLNIGLEDSTDRLMGSIVEISDQVPDNFRLDIILAIEKLCQQYPQKYMSFLHYLGSQIKEDRTIVCKELLVTTIRNVVLITPESAKLALSILCDYVEDCEYEPLTGKVMSTIVELARHTPDPKAYIYVIHNRLILENAHIRVATIGALCEIAKDIPETRPALCLLLEKSAEDTDDSVRHICSIYSRALACGSVPFEDDSTAESDLELTLIEEKLPKLVQYLNELDQNNELATTKVDLDVVSQLESVVEVPQPAEVKRGVVLEAVVAETAPSTVHYPTTTSSILDEIQPMTDIQLGSVIHSTAYESLTEEEAEYLVEVSKIFFSSSEAQELVALEFRLTNTLEDIDLRQVVPRISNVTVVGVRPIAELSNGDTKFAYALIQTSSYGRYPVNFTFTSFENGMDGVKDEYAVEPITLSIKDRISPTFMDKSELAAVWQQLESSGDSVEQEHKYMMPNITSIAQSFIEVIKATGFYGNDKEIDRLKDADKGVLILSGKIGGKIILAKVWVKNKEGGKGNVTRIVYRSESSNTSLTEKLFAAFKSSLGIQT